MSLASIALAAACLEAMEQKGVVHDIKSKRLNDFRTENESKWLKSKADIPIARVTSPSAENGWVTCHTSHTNQSLGPIAKHNVKSVQQELVLSPNTASPYTTMVSSVPQILPNSSSGFVRHVSMGSDDGSEVPRQTSNVAKPSCPIVSPGSVFSEVSDEETKVSPPTSRSTSISAPVADGIAVNDNDVLCGRGGETNHHPGNVRYRALVKEMQHQYLLAKRRDKPQIARKIVDVVRSRNGRFLKRCPTRGEWREIGQNKAREKTSQALREGAPEIREIYGSGAVCNGNGSSVATKKDQTPTFPVPQNSGPMHIATSHTGAFRAAQIRLGNNDGPLRNVEMRAASTVLSSSLSYPSSPSAQQGASSLVGLSSINDKSQLNNGFHQQKVVQQHQQQQYLVARSSSARSVTSSSSSSEDEEQQRKNEFNVSSSAQSDYAAARVVLQMYRGGNDTTKQCPQVPDMKSKKRKKNHEVHPRERRNSLPSQLRNSLPSQVEEPQVQNGQEKLSFFPNLCRRASDPGNPQKFTAGDMPIRDINTLLAPRGPRTKFFKARFNALTTSTSNAGAEFAEHAACETRN
mmetsp:Transcript_53779/g.62860  ORF Transcript_53779/g.62860 Transcript_53779/m.62860 type:complete len:576 (+) Transcript_53779:102-1829(+)